MVLAIKIFLELVLETVVKILIQILPLPQRFLSYLVRMALFAIASVFLIMHGLEPTMC